MRKKNILYRADYRAAKSGQKSLVLARWTQRTNRRHKVLGTNQERTLLYVLHDPHLPRFQQGLGSSVVRVTNFLKRRTRVRIPWVDRIGRWKDPLSTMIYLNRSRLNLSNKIWYNCYRLWMRSSLAWLERLNVNAIVATVLGSIPASYDTMKSKETTDEAVLNKVHKKSPKIPILELL